MPKFSVWAVRLSVISFVIGFTIGGLLLINKAIPIKNELWLLRPAHIEFLFFGWVVQLVYAIGYWMFPRYKAKPGRGKTRFAWASLVLLNLGLLSAALSPMISSPRLSLFGRTLEALSILVFSAFIWGRVKPTETGKAIARNTKERKSRRQ